jgi:hypothetical protein
MDTDLDEGLDGDLGDLLLMRCLFDFGDCTFPGLTCRSCVGGD